MLRAVNFLLLRSLDARSLTSSIHRCPDNVTTSVLAYNVKIKQREKTVYNRLVIRTRIGFQNDRRLGVNKQSGVAL
jgi:hypothetical protein